MNSLPLSVCQARWRRSTPQRSKCCWMRAAKTALADAERFCASASAHAQRHRFRAGRRTQLRPEQQATANLLSSPFADQPVPAPDALDSHVREGQVELALETGSAEGGQLSNYALRPDEFFFFLSAHLFFIKTDNRSRPAAVKWRFRFLGDPLVAGMLRSVLPSSSAAIARSRRFLWAFSSDTILCVSKLAPRF